MQLTALFLLICSLFAVILAEDNSVEREASETAAEGDGFPGEDKQFLRAFRSGSSANGKPTFIRFGKRGGPSFIRFGKRAGPSFIRFGRSSPDLY